MKKMVEVEVEVDVVDVDVVEWLFLELFIRVQP